jgi:hypothetical protein
MAGLPQGVGAAEALWSDVAQEPKYLCLRIQSLLLAFRTGWTLAATGREYQRARSMELIAYSQSFNLRQTVAFFTLAVVGFFLGLAFLTQSACIS